MIAHGCLWTAAHYKIPILMLTGRAGIHERVVGLEAGADDYIVKPFAGEELVNAPESAMRRIRGNRIGMVVIPLVASAVATASGAAGVFVILAITLSSSAAGIWTSRRND